MRVAILVPRIHFQAPFVLLALVPRAREGLDRYLVVTTPKLPPRRVPLWRKLAGLLAASGPDYLLAMASARALQAGGGLFERLARRPATRRKWLTVPEACRLLGAETAAVRSVREPALAARLAAFRPDLLCAVFFNQVVPPDLRALPLLGALNVHPSFLPSYRGVSPCFWVLARGETSTGVTIHGMTGELDSGPILAQDRISISSCDTVHSLYRRCALRGGELLAGLLADPERLRSPGTAPEASGSYFASITPSAVRQLRARGRRFI